MRRIGLIVLLGLAGGCPGSNGDGDGTCDVTLSRMELSLANGASDTVIVTMATDQGMLLSPTVEGPVTASYAETPALTEAGAHTLTITCTGEDSAEVYVWHQSPFNADACKITIAVTCTATAGGGTFDTGDYDQVDGQGPLAFVGAPFFHIFQAGSAGSVIFDVLRLELLLEFRFFEAVVALASANGHPMAVFGFPGLWYTTWNGSAYPQVTQLETATADALVAVPGASSSSANLWAPLHPRVCALFSDKTISCYDAVGDELVKDAASVTDTNFIDPCDAVGPVGRPISVAVAGDHALVLESTGTVCHGQLGTGNQSAQAFTFSDIARGMSCPVDATGASPLCGVLKDGGFDSVLWPTPSAAPTQGITVATCSGSRGIDGFRTAEQTCFVYACSTEGVVEEICLENAGGTLVSHTTIDQPNCNSRNASYANETQIGIACTTSARIFDRADMTPK